MTAPTQTTRAASGAAARPTRYRLTRVSEGRVFYGVAAGIASHAGIDSTLVRTAFALLSLAGGLGVVLYLGLALVLPQRPEAARLRVKRSDAKAVAGVGLITLGLMLAARQAGFWFGDALVGPIAVAAFGASLLWVRNDAPAPGGDATMNPLQALLQGRVSMLRALSGGLLIFVGAGTFLAVNADPYSAPLQIVRMLVLPVVATIAGLLLIFGPWLYRLASQVTEERRERIRSEERSALAAHLHDSVLQTLALIQRADDPQRMAHLARTQERELRAWLFGKVGSLEGETLSGALEALAGRCESRYPVNVDVVVVGDAPMDERLRALTAACGEAITNAARHSGSSTITVYAECEEQVVTVYVRDEGAGFTVTSVEPDRRGIKDSIEGRMRRVGGTAVVQSVIGSGTEVILTMPRTPA